MRIQDMIIEDEFCWYFNNFSPLLLQETYVHKEEFVFWYWGLKG